MPALIDRDTERTRLDGLLDAARAGRSSALVLRGEAGVGKSALLEYAVERAAGWQVIRTLGVESEMELPFAGLQHLCAPLLGRLESLPLPQGEALGTAFGLTSSPSPDRFLISLAVLSLFSDATDARPLLCLVDDAQWLDRSSAQALAFVARRLQEESVVLLFAARETSEPDDLAGLPDLALHGLADIDARALLDQVIATPLDDRVRERIITETRGNPLALLVLPHDASPVDLAGGFALPREISLPRRIEASFARRVAQLPLETQRLLLVAAAEPTGDPALLSRAVSAFDIPLAAAAPAESDGLLELGQSVAFRHPLLRSAVYRAAAADERRAVHEALATATDAERDPDRRAWHRAQATLVADEDVAAELERSAGRAEDRGGLAAAAAFLERAAALTPERGRRARRALAAAEAKLLAGAPQAARLLLATAADGPLEELDQVMLLRLQGQIALDLRHGGEAEPLLLEAARRFESLDPGLARETYGEALRAASIAGRLGSGILESAEAARKAPTPAGTPRAVDLLLDALALRFTEGYTVSAPTLRRALRAILSEGGTDDVRWPWFGRRVAPDLFEDETWHVLATRNVQMARDRGALAVLPLALNYLALLRCFEGDLRGAAALIDEADAIAEATGSDPIAVARGLQAACVGDETAVINADERAARARGEGVVITFGEHARAVLYNGLGRYEQAVAAAQAANAADELALSVWSLPELVEAAVRCGRTGMASDALEQLSERTRAAGTDYAAGIEARSRALLSEGSPAEGLFAEAIECLSRSRMKLDLARARLVYGEWLRRERRHVDARAQLRAAHETFASMGAEAFAARAARELLAAGEKVSVRAAAAHDDSMALTAQEAQIAQLASDGLSNPQIGAQLFISPRTVEYHLRKVFGKLSISSRSQLYRALTAQAGE